MTSGSDCTIAASTAASTTALINLLIMVRLLSVSSAWIRPLQDEMARVIEKFRTYGQQDASDPGLVFGGESSR